ncbi:hypothetical protein KKC59_02640, partial [bacterium]|nr:hypothetical protein [bacterium]
MEIRAEADRNFQKLCNSSETKEKDLELLTEEIWLLWKLGNKEEVTEKLPDLLKKYPVSADFLLLSILIDLEKNRLDSAEKTLPKLELVSNDKQLIKELKGSLYISQKKWDQAEKTYLDLLQEKPDDVEYLRNYTESLYNQNKWNQARDYYSKLIKTAENRKDLIWDYRETLTQEGGNSLNTKFYGFTGPDSQRQNIFSEQGIFWLDQTLKLNTEIFHERYKKSEQSASPKMKKQVTGGLITLTKFNQSKNLFLKSGIESCHLEKKDFISPLLEIIRNPFNFFIC